MAYYRKRGKKWSYRLSYKDPFTGENKLKERGGFLTKKEAQLAAAQMEKEINEGMRESDQTLVKYLKEWLYDYKKDTIRENTFKIHKNNIENHIEPYFKQIKLTDLQPMMYQKFLNQLTNSKKSKRTVEIIHGTIYAALDRAVILGHIKHNPCKGVAIKGETKKREIEYIPSDQIQQFLATSYQYGYIYWLFFKMLIETGMRKGEAGALRWTDVDLNNQRIKIQTTIDYSLKPSATASALFGDAKTYNSRRTITISNGLTEALKVHMKWQNQNKLAVGELYRHDLNLVHCRADGSFIPKSSLFNSFSRILKRTGIEPLPIHSLRHTHAVLLLEAGTDMKYIQERLGHGSIQITADVYSHISKKLEKDHMDKFETYTKGILD